MLPLTLQVAQVMDLVPRAEVPDMPDRIVAATAVAYKLPLVSQDSEVRDSASLKALVPIIWQQYGRILAESTTGGLLAAPPAGDSETFGRAGRAGWHKPACSAGRARYRGRDPA